MKFSTRVVFAIFVVCASCGEEEKAPDDGLIFNVPRTETASGTSILDNPTADRGRNVFAILCPKQQVYCNGECLAAVGAQAGNCTLLQNNIGWAGSIAVDGSSLYYTANDSEILRMDLASLTHTSLAAGVVSPSALYPAGGLLYFGNNPIGDAVSDLRMISKDTAPQVTVLTEHLEAPFGIYQAGGEILVAAGGFGNGPLYGVPTAGGRWTEYVKSEIYHFEAVGENLYFSMNTETEDGLFASTLANPGSYSQVASGNPTGDPISNFFVQGGNIYWFASKAANTSKVFTSVPVSGGAKREIQTAGDGILLAHNSQAVFYSDRGVSEVIDQDTDLGTDLGTDQDTDLGTDLGTDQDTEDTTVAVSNVMMLSLSGGDPVVLATCEPSEIKAVAADEAHLYIAVGYARTGGILRIDL